MMPPPLMPPSHYPVSRHPHKALIQPPSTAPIPPIPYWHHATNLYCHHAAKPLLPPSYQPLTAPIPLLPPSHHLCTAPILPTFGGVERKAWAVIPAPPALPSLVIIIPALHVPPSLLLPGWGEQGRGGGGGPSPPCIPLGRHILPLQLPQRLLQGRAQGAVSCCRRACGGPWLPNPTAGPWLPLPHQACSSPEVAAGPRL